MSERSFCTTCDAEIYLSDYARVVQQTNGRKVVIDDHRCHICLTGPALANVLRRIDAGATGAEVTTYYNLPAAAPAVEESVAGKPVPADGDWVEEFFEEAPNA